VPGAVDVVGLVAFLLRPTLISALDALVDEEKDDAASLSHEERQRREAELREDLLSVERDEAALTWRAMDENLPASHRPDCSPLAILQVQLRTAPRAIDGPTTSPLAYDVVQPRR
jgi:hypothetical protein